MNFVKHAKINGNRTLSVKYSNETASILKVDVFKKLVLIYMGYVDCPESPLRKLSVYPDVYLTTRSEVKFYNTDSINNYTCIINNESNKLKMKRYFTPKKP